MKFNESGEIVASISTIIISAILICYPFFLLFFLIRQKNKLKEEMFEQRFSSIYENLDT